jgi:DNA-binding MarR family transcriptional regulator
MMNATIDNRETALEVVEIVPLVMRIVAAELRRSQGAMIPAHLGVLFLLTQQSRNLSELAEQQAVSLPTMSNTVSKMAQEGWIKRTRAAHDRRMLLIEITPAGEAALAEISGHIIAAVARILQPLSAADLDTLRAGLAILRRSFIHGSPTF